MPLSSSRLLRRERDLAAVRALRLLLQVREPLGSSCAGVLILAENGLQGQVEVGVLRFVCVLSECLLGLLVLCLLFQTDEIVQQPLDPPPTLRQRHLLFVAFDVSHHCHYFLTKLLFFLYVFEDII